MSLIRLKNIKLYGYHGYAIEEQTRGQRFELDIEVDTDYVYSNGTDNLDQTVDYAEIYSLTEKVFLHKRYNLIETVASRIGSEILKLEHINSVIVRIRKPHVPVDGIFDYIEVEIKQEDKS